MPDKYPTTRTFDSDTALSILGVPGRLKVRSVCYKTNVGCWEHQTWVSERRTQVVDGQKLLLQAEVRFDDCCHNGNNSFAITGSGWYDRYKSQDIDFGGCCHDLIAKMFPELEPLIRWHLVSTDSPMHYVANTVFHAGDRDCWGRLKGEPRAWERHLRFGTSPIRVKVKSKFLDWLIEAEQHKKTTPATNPNRRNYEIVAVPYVPSGTDYKFAPKFTFDDYGTQDPVKAWYSAPFDSRDEAEEFKQAMAGDFEVVTVATAWGEGKERDFDAARRTGLWPDATDEQLSLPKEELTKLLEERLAPLVAEFRVAMTSAGMYWSPEEYDEAHKEG